MKYHLKPYKCNVEDCDYRAGQPHKLRQHVVTFHAPGGSKARSSLSSRKTAEVLDRCVKRALQTREDGSTFYQCTFANCEASFESEVDVRAHLAAHFEIPDDYVCKYCDKAFSSAEQRNMHVKYGHMAERNSGFKLMPTPTKGAAPSTNTSYFSSPSPAKQGASRRPEGSLQCTFPGCDFISPDKKKLEMHQLQKHKVRPCVEEF